MSCSQAQGRVPATCNDFYKKKEACAKVCGSASECMKNVYLTGKADCQGSSFDQNDWMHPKKVCCGKHPYFTDGKIIAFNC